jgi:processive 1,2-diacylglycerol beta-glucosyltransferase
MRRRPRVLILSSSVGGGHDAAARALADELERQGAVTSSGDALRWIGSWAFRLVTGVYRLQLAHAPWTYDLVYRALLRWPALGLLAQRLTGCLGARRVGERLRALRPDVVLTTYHLATAVAVRARERGWWSGPVVAVITDLAVHPIWVVREADVHLVYSEESARAVRRLGGRARVVRPLVDGAFERSGARASSAERSARALVVGGAWGVGRLEEAAEAAARAGWTPVVVAGRNGDLARRLARRKAEGWEAWGYVAGLEELMRGARAVVVSGPGATCLEAFAARRPVIFYRPIPGHGWHNAALLEELGLARFARSAAALEEHLRALIGGTGMEVERAWRLFSAPRATEALEEVVAAAPAVLPPRRLRARPRIALRVAVAALAALALVTSSPGLEATARMLHRPVAMPGGRSQAVALCVRLGDPDLADAALRVLAARGAHATFFLPPEEAGGPLAAAVVRAGDEVGLAEPRSRIRVGAVARLFHPHARAFNASYLLPRSGRLPLSALVVAGRVRPVLGASSVHGDRVSPRRGAIVLVDVARQADVQRLDGLVAALEARGLRVVTLSTLERARAAVPRRGRRPRRSERDPRRTTRASTLLATAVPRPREHR